MQRLQYRLLSIRTPIWLIESGLLLATLFLFALSVPVPQAAAQSCVAPPSGLVSWWPGEGNANDIADGNDGALQNGATFAPGMVGQAFSFDGVNDHVLVPDAANLNFGPPSPMSVDAWVFKTGTAGVMHILGKRVGCGSFHYQLAFDANGLGFGAAVSGISPPLNEWTHVAGTFDGSTFRIYVDGELKGTAAGTLGAANTQPLKIGASGTCGGLWQGRIDEVEIHDRALAAEEIAAIFDAGSAGKCKLDHFLCYKAKSTPGTEKFAPRDVSLKDQFDTEPGTVNVKKPVSLCNPADKNEEGINDPDTHLKGYKILPETAHVPQTNIKVVNQFGELFVDTIKPDRLLVPSLKDLDNPVILPDPFEPNVDHFKCYKVKVTPGTPKLPKGIQASVKDQFNEVAKLFDVKKPSRLCNPVDKNGEGIKNAAAHLMCYKAKPAAGEPKHIPLTGIHVNNQFGPEQLDTIKEEELCVPSVKILPTP